MKMRLLPFLLIGIQLAACANAASGDGPSPWTRIPLKNPQMTDISNQPAHWTQTWVGNGSIKVSRDTATYHSAPPSLALEAIGGVARGCVQRQRNCPRCTVAAEINP